MKRLIIIIICFLISVISHAQTILNAYAKVSGINVGATTLTVTNVNEANHTFTVGGSVIIMQMQDNCIGTNTTNASTFGDLGTIANAGRYEIRKIVSRLPATGTPTSITLDFALSYIFNTGANSSTQLITFRNMGTNFTTSANVTGLAWNGNIGGVVAFEVGNTLTLNNSINADAIGFLGGTKNTPNAYSTCDATTYQANIGSRYASKGEGIYKNTTAAFRGARGKILNGGGSGNDVNSGGGGGGNYTAGGIGGLGWVPAGTGCSPSAGGLGGISLSASISSSRIFMGGGGGGGHENDGLGTVGGKGGGIVLIKANRISTLGVCAGISISANGANALSAANDGAGGGGAAGSIILEVNSYSISNTCSLSIISNGGSAGSSITTGVHGAGGGGGQGVVIFSIAQPTQNITTSTTPGAGGSSCSGCPSSANGVAGGGPNNAGVLSNVPSPLPIDLVNFSASCDNILENVKIEWTTATEKNNDLFIIEKSVDALNWIKINQTKGAGNSYYTIKYKFEDYDVNSNAAYYRLTQVDFDQQSKTFQNIAYVENCQKTNFDFDFYPNPAQEIIYLKNINNANVTITNAMGQELEITFTNSNELDISSFINGIYFIKITDKIGNSKTKKFVKNML